MILRSLLLLFSLTLPLPYAYACPGSYAGTDQSSVDFTNQNLSGCDFTQVLSSQQPILQVRTYPVPISLTRP